MAIINRLWVNTGTTDLSSDGTDDKNREKLRRETERKRNRVRQVSNIITLNMITNLGCLDRAAPLCGYASYLGPTDNYSELLEG